MYVQANQVAFLPGFWTKISKPVIDYQIQSTCTDHPVFLVSIACIIEDKIQSRNLNGPENNMPTLVFAALEKK